MRTQPTNCSSSAAVGVACARALRSVGLQTLQLKWPNDLWVDHRKLGGILIEHRGEAGGACRVVIGIGLNVAMSNAQADGIDQAWISLDEALGTKASRNAVASALLTALHGVVGAFEYQGFAPLAAEWSALDLTRDQPVQITGTPSYQGIARGVDEIGALQVDVDGERRAVHSGDVSLRLAS